MSDIIEEYWQRCDKQTDEVSRKVSDGGKVVLFYGMKKACMILKIKRFAILY